MITKTKHVQDVIEHAIDGLKDGKGTEQNACDLHHYLFNEDYFIIGTWNAKQWLGNDSWEAIEKIQEYENFHFGEVYSDLSSPEKVANLYAYILGEEVLAECEHFQSCWGENLMPCDIEMIIDELEAL